MILNVLKKLFGIKEDHRAEEELGLTPEEICQYLCRIDEEYMVIPERYKREYGKFVIDLGELIELRIQGIYVNQGCYYQDLGLADRARGIPAFIYNKRTRTVDLIYSSMFRDTPTEILRHLFEKESKILPEIAIKENARLKKERAEKENERAKIEITKLLRNMTASNASP